MVNSDEIDLYNVCRSCLLNLEDMKSLEDEYTDGTCVREVFTSITAVECSDLPSQMCLNCFSELNRSYKFVLKCRESDKKIRHYLNNIQRPVDHSENTQFNQNIQFVNVDIKVENDLTTSCMSVPAKLHTEIQTCLDTDVDIVKNEIDFMSKIPITYVNIKNEYDNQLDTNLDNINHEENRYSCTVSDEFSTETSNLEHHFQETQKLHTGEKLYSCDTAFGQNICSKNESSGTSILKQQLTALQPQQEKPYSCTTCDKSFTHKCHLTRHLQTHAAKKLYSCTICDNVYHNKGNLLRHNRTVHTSRKLIAIRPAEKPRSPSENCLLQSQIHLTRTSSANVTCETEKKPHLCTVCSMSFMYKESLTRHRHTHKVAKVYPCTLCTKSFFNNTRLTQHIRTHTGEKPYTCTVCDKSFTHVEYLNRHSQLHGKAVQYLCTVCNQSFSAKGSLTRHLRTVHQNGATISTPTTNTQLQ